MRFFITFATLAAALFCTSAAAFPQPVRLQARDIDTMRETSMLSRRSTDYSPLLQKRALTAHDLAVMEHQKAANSRQEAYTAHSHAAAEWDATAAHHANNGHLGSAAQASLNADGHRQNAAVHQAWVEHHHDEITSGGQLNIHHAQEAAESHAIAQNSINNAYHSQQAARLQRHSR